MGSCAWPVLFHLDANWVDVCILHSSVFGWGLAPGRVCSWVRDWEHFLESDSAERLQPPNTPSSWGDDISVLKGRSGQCIIVLTIAHPFCCLDYFLCKLSSTNSSSGILVGSPCGKFKRGKFAGKNTTSVTAVTEPEAPTNRLPLLLPILYPLTLGWPLCWSWCLSWWGDLDSHPWQIWDPGCHALLRLWLWQLVHLLSKLGKRLLGDSPRDDLSAKHIFP